VRQLLLLGVVAAALVASPSRAHAENVQGVANVSSGLAAIKPVAIGGESPVGSSAFCQLDANGNLLVTQGLNLKTDPAARITPTATNGATAVTLVSGSSGKVIYLGTIIFDNEDTVTHTVQVLSSGGTVLLRFQLQASCGLVLDGRGDIRTVAGEGLQFKIDSGGTGNTVYASGAAVQE
jgi:hypothetical protein